MRTERVQFFREVLRGIRQRYADVFVGERAAEDFEKLMEWVDDFLKILEDEKTSPAAKLILHDAVKEAVARFRYQFWLPMTRWLTAELSELLEEVREELSEEVTV